MYEEIKKEIERRKQEIFPVKVGGQIVNRGPKSVESGYLNALDWVLSFIESLEKEQPQVQKIKGWVVRDSFGLEFYRRKPYRVIGEISHWTDKLGPNSEWFLDESLFPELKWEDDPIEVELTINKL